MQIQRENISETKVKLTIELGLEELTHAKQHELQEQAKNMKVAGFRKGKAPLTVIEKQLDENQFQATVINHAINDFYGKAVQDEGLKTIAQPEITIGKFVPFTELTFTAEVDIMAKPTLGDYKKIKKSAPKVTVTAKDVTEVLENIAKNQAKKEPSKKPAKNGDEVIIDFNGKNKKGEAVAGASGKDYALTLGSNTFIPGFEEGLIGAKVGDKKELALQFPKEYHAKELAGTDIIFTVEVKDVLTITPPVFDDAFAAAVGPFASLDELKADIKTQLTEQKEQEAKNKVKDEIIEELVKKSKVTLPDVLVEDQVAMLEQDMVQNLAYRGITKPEYIKQQGFKDEAEWKKKELVPQAERRVSVGIVLAEVAEQESIRVTEDEISQQVAIYKQQYQQSADQFDRPEMRREVASRLLTEKTINLLYDIATK